MMNTMNGFWTKERPTHDGFYFYRENKQDVQPVHWDQEMQWVEFTGCEIRRGDDCTHPITGEFWSIEIKMPDIEP